MTRLPFWKSYEKRAKALLGFLRSDPFMDSVRIKADDQGCSPAFKKAISRSSGRWAKWRMGTVNKTSRNLEEVLPELVLIFDPADFNVKDGPGFKLVCEAITDPSFAFENTIVRYIARENESLRGFCRGCPCHPEACKDARKKGGTYECPNNMKSRIGPAYKEFIEALLSYWEGWPLTVDPMVVGGDGYNGTLVMGIQVQSGLVAFKFGFIDLLPWSLWRASSPAGMKACRILYLADQADDEIRPRTSQVAHIFSKLRAKWTWIVLLSLRRASSLRHSNGCKLSTTKLRTTKYTRRAFIEMPPRFCVMARQSRLHVLQLPYGHRKI